MVSVIDHQQPKEFQQLLIFWVNEVRRLLPAVIFQLGISTQRKKVTGENTGVTMLSEGDQRLFATHSYTCVYKLLQISNF